MAEYGGVLLGVCLLGSMIRMLSPEGDMKRYLGLVVAFCVILSVASPLVTFWEEGGLSFLEEGWEMEEGESKSYAEIFDQTLLSSGEEFAEKQAEGLILQRFSLEEGDLSVEGDFELKNGTNTLRGMTLILHKSTLSVDPRELSEFVEERFLCRCEVIYQ